MFFFAIVAFGPLGSATVLLVPAQRLVPIAAQLVGLGQTDIASP